MPCFRERFYEHFDVLRANSSNLLQQSLRLRYQVYCVEKGYEDPENYPRGMESDTYDLRSDHHVVKHKVSGRVLGTVRIILPDSMDSSLLFPVEHLCGGAIDKDLFRRVAVNRRRIGEISRFAISKDARRCLDLYQQGENVVHFSKDIPVLSKQEIRMLQSQIVIGLFHSIVKTSAEQELTHWIAVMESSLSRLFTRFGFRFEPLGAPVECRGLRRPCYAVIDDVLARAHKNFPQEWDLVTDSGKLWPAPQNKIYHIA